MTSRMETGILTKKDKATCCCNDEVTYLMRMELKASCYQLPRRIQELPTEQRSPELILTECIDTWVTISSKPDR